MRMTITDVYISWAVNQKVQLILLVVSCKLYKLCPLWEDNLHQSGQYLCVTHENHIQIC